MDKIPVMEIFGPTIQGEGRVIGQKTMFVRTGGCDYRCNWCDSKFTWDGTEKAKMMTPEEIMEDLMQLGSFVSGNDDKGYPVFVRNFNHVTISGGNPALIGTPMSDLLYLLERMGIETSLETQGSRWQDWFRQIDDLCISPKPPSSGMETNWDTLDLIIKNLTSKYSPWEQPYLKVVVFDDRDFEFAKKVHARYPHIEFFVSVGNLEPYSSRELTVQLLESLEWLFNKVLTDPEMNKAKPLPQLHTLVWGNRRGV